MDEVAPSSRPSLPLTARSRTGSAPYVFWILFGVSFLNYLDRYLLSGSINTIAGEFHMSIEQVGYISSAFLLVYTIATLPLGIWADRSKRKNIVAFCVAAWSIITVLTALTTNFITLFISRMFLGIGEAGYFPAGTALMSDYYSRRKRSRIMSWWNIAQVIGILVGSVVGGVVAGLATGSWRWSFVFTGIPGLVFAWLAWRIKEPRRNQADEEEGELEDVQQMAVLREEQPGATAEPERLSQQIMALLRIKTLLVLTAMSIFAFFVLYVGVSLLSTYLQQKDIYGLKPGAAGIYSGGIIALAGMVGTIAGGYLADMLSRRYAGARVLVCGIGFFCCAPAFAIAISTRNLTVFTLFFVLTAILLTFYQGPSTAALQDVVPAKLRATALCISLLIAHLLGDAFSPTIVGVLARHFDPTPNGAHFATMTAGHDLSLALLLTCVPALLIAGLIALFGARWMAADVEAAERANLQASNSQAS